MLIVLHLNEYIATKEFYSGDLDIYIQKGERIGFDGVKALVRGDEMKAPHLGAAIRTKLLEIATVDALGQALSTPIEKSESPAEKAERLKAERLAKVYGATGNGVPFDEKKGQQVDKRMPRREIALKERVAKESKAKLDIQKETKMPVITETEGVEVGKVKKTGVAIETDPKSFYEAMLEGEHKKLSVDQDSYVPKSKVIKVDSQSEAVEVKKLVSADQVTPAGDPLKDWGKMNATRKQAFIKKQKDVEVLKKIVESETGETKRKAMERLKGL